MAGTRPIVFYPKVTAIDDLGAPSKGRGAPREAWATRLGDGSAAVQDADGVRTVYAETKWVVPKFGHEDISVEWTFTDIDGTAYDIVSVQDRTGSRDEFVITGVRRDKRR